MGPVPSLPSIHQKKVEQMAARMSVARAMRATPPAERWAAAFQCRGAPPMAGNDVGATKAALSPEVGVEVASLVALWRQMSSAWSQRQTPRDAICAASRRSARRSQWLRQSSRAEQPKIASNDSSDLREGVHGSSMLMANLNTPSCLARSM